MQDWKLLLGARDFRRLWLALLGDYLGSWCVIATLPILVAERFGTGDALVVSLAVRVLPRITLAPIAGSLLQRYGAARVGAITLGLSSLLTAALPWCTQYVVLQVMLLAIGMLDVFVIPAMFTLRSPVTPRGLEMPGNTLFAAADRLAKFAGPALGGLAVSVGLTVAYAGFGVAILAAAACIMRLPHDALLHDALLHDALPHDALPGTSPQSAPIGSVLRDFAMMLRRDRVVRALLYCGVPYMITFGGMRPFLFWANLQWFPGTDAAWTALLTAQGIGALIGVVVSGLCSRSLLRLMSAYELLLATSLLEGLAHLSLLCANTMGMAMLLLVFSGIPEMLAYAAYVTCIQERLPPHRQTIFYSMQQPLFDIAFAIGIASASLHANGLLSLGMYWALMSFFSTVPNLPLIAQHWRARRKLPMSPWEAEH